MIQKISTFLWFDTEAEEAAHFYVSIFKNSEIRELRRFSDEVPGPKGKALIVDFVLDGQRFIALNGGPDQKLTPAMSLMVFCESQQEIDELWGKLTADGGEPGVCGWLTDRFGLSWQIVPDTLTELLQEVGDGAGDRAMKALMEMTKLDVAALRDARKQKVQAGL